VYKFRVWEKHKRTVSIHHPDAILLTEGNRLRAHGAFTSGAVDPYIPNACRCAILHHPNGLGERRHYQYALHWFFHGLQALKALTAINFLGHKINRNHVVTAVAHFPKEQAAEVLGISRHAHHRDAAERKKVFDVMNCGHDVPPWGDTSLQNFPERIFSDTRHHSLGLHNAKWSSRAIAAVSHELPAAALT
jgi:hypothetical protein